MRETFTKYIINFERLYRINYSKFATDTCYNDIRNIQNIDLTKRREIENLSFKKIIFKNVHLDTQIQKQIF